jgi:hypothetical protein
MADTVEPAFLHGIGKVSFNFSVLEYLLKLLIHVLVGGSDQRVGQCITAEIRFRSLVELARALHLVREGDPAVRERLAALLKRCNKIEERRNPLIHSNWGAGEGGAYVRIKTTTRKAKGLQWQMEATATSDIERLAKDIHMLAEELRAFLHDQKYRF